MIPQFFVYYHIKIILLPLQKLTLIINDMDSKALYSISYGVFILGSHDDKKINACVTNTCMQVSANPARLAITVINQNYTCQQIKACGTFALSVLDKSVTFDTIECFGFQSGHKVDKFDGFEHALDSNGNPYLKSQACALFSCKVISSQDLGSHTLFIAEIEDSKVLSDKAPLTYADYHKDVKPKAGTADAANTGKKIIGWRCKICGYEYQGAELPADFECPICGHPAEDFEPIYEK